jgi:hypothetical protein
VLVVVEMTPARTNALRSPNRLALMEASEVADSSVMQAGALISTRPELRGMSRGRRRHGGRGGASLSR